MEQLIDHEVRIRMVENGILHLDTKIDTAIISIDRKFDKLDSKIDSHFKWTLGIMFSLTLGMCGLMVTILFQIANGG